MVALVTLDHLRLGVGIDGVWLAPVLIVVTILAAEETISLLRNQKHDPLAWTVYAGSLLLVLSGCDLLIKQLLVRFGYPSYPPWEGWPALALAAGVILAFGGEMARFKKAGESSIVNAALAIFAMAYVGGLMLFLAWQRLHHGTFAFLTIPIIVKCGDTGAYFTGRFTGRHKMTPLLSPGKTWEGAVGGVVAGCLASWFCFAVLQPKYFPDATPTVHPPLVAVLIYGLAMTLAGMHGDLAESLLKRDMQRKDSSTWLPGLGGVLDVVDSMLMAAPVAYLFWNTGWLG